MRISALATAAALVFAVGGVSAQEISDAQIAWIVAAADQVDIDAGNLARTATTRPEVKQFAERMIVDHGGVSQSIAELMTKLKITPVDNPTAQSLRSGGDANLANLRTLKGDAFDKAYVEHEIAYHQQVLDALDKTLIPGAKNERLKTLLGKVKLSFLAHLEHAKMIQSR